MVWIVTVVVVTFFNHNFVNCKATLILVIKIYEIKYIIYLFIMKFVQLGTQIKTQCKKENIQNTQKV